MTALILALLIALSPVNVKVQISNVELITYEDDSMRYESDMIFPNGQSFVIGSQYELQEGTYTIRDMTINGHPFMFLQCNDDQSFCR